MFKFDISQLLIIIDFLALFAGLFLFSKYIKKVQNRKLIIVFYLIYFFVFCFIVPLLINPDKMKWLLKNFIQFDFSILKNDLILAFALLFGSIPFVGKIRRTKIHLSGKEWLILIIFVLLNPFFEEVFWRGYLFYQFFENPGVLQFLLMGFLSSLGISLFHYFALGNISEHFKTRQSLISLFVGSCFFCLFYAFTHSILTSFLSHLIISITGGLTLLKEQEFFKK